MDLNTIFYIIVLIYSIILHEIGHAIVADIEGDKTARLAGRITLNPIPHIDPLGSVIFPILSYLSFGGAMGWAKGVPYNPANLRRPKIGEALVSVAGIATNLIIAIFFGLICRFFLGENSPFFNICLIIVLVNTSLAFFNLLPIPPFDGARIFTALFPKLGKKYVYMADSLGPVALIASIVLASYIWKFLSPLVYIFARFIIGS
jgi:Zn-dependent protease